MTRATRGRVVTKYHYKKKGGEDLGEILFADGAATLCPPEGVDAAPTWPPHPPFRVDTAVHPLGWTPWGTGLAS